MLFAFGLTYHRYGPGFKSLGNHFAKVDFHMHAPASAHAHRWHFQRDGKIAV